MAGATKAYPDVRVVEGDLEDVDLVEKEARDADIVIRNQAWTDIYQQLTMTRCCQHQT